MFLCGEPSDSTRCAGLLCFCWMTGAKSMDGKLEIDRESIRSAPQEQISSLLHENREEVLFALLENPHFDESHLCLLLGRKELSSIFLEEIAGHKEWMTSYRVRRGLAFHPHLSQTLGLRLVRELYLADQVQLTFSPSGAPALRHLAEDLVLSKLPQLPPSQKMALARRASVRIIGALLVDASPEVVPTVLDSPFLSEGQVLRALARIMLPARVVAAIAEHRRWSSIYSVRLALLRNSQAPLARVIAFLPSISTTDLRVLAESSSVPSNLRPHIRRELANRMQHGKAPSKARSLT